MSYYVYLAACRDGSLYTGTAPDVDARLVMHQSGHGAKYTRSRLPIHGVYREALADKGEALRREIAVKRLGHAEKQAMADAYQLAHPAVTQVTSPTEAQVRAVAATLGCSLPADALAHVLFQGAADGAPVAMASLVATVYRKKPSVLVSALAVAGPYRETGLVARVLVAITALLGEDRQTGYLLLPADAADALQLKDRLRLTPTADGVMYQLTILRAIREAQKRDSRCL